MSELCEHGISPIGCWDHNCHRPALSAGQVISACHACHVDEGLVWNGCEECIPNTFPNACCSQMTYTETDEFVTCPNCNTEYLYETYRRVYCPVHNNSYGSVENPVLFVGKWPSRWESCPSCGLDYSNAEYAAEVKAKIKNSSTTFP